MSENIVVVIPHYQLQPGILARTLARVFQQTWGLPSRVVIIDDSSPAPACDELADLDPVCRGRIEIIQRPNGGPARARNTGLDAVINNANFVALLDCDDSWSAWHLDDAMAAMRLGYDFFFGDHIREGDELSQLVKFPIDETRLRLLDSERRLYAWTGGMFDTVLRFPVIGLSTVVFRAARVGEIRFSDQVGLADDLLYALDVARIAPAVALSARMQAVYGVGNNLSIVHDWHSNKALYSIASLARYNAKVMATAPLDARQRRFVTDRLSRTRYDFAVTLLWMLRAGIAVDTDFARGFLREHPATLLKVAPAVLNAVVKRFSRPYR
jgi:succinoglycan biosynthesis protein ExoW